MGSEQREILIIDDSAAHRSALSVLLRGKGYSVALATIKCEGFKIAAGHAFDLILLDTIGPRWNDLTVCRDIRQAGIATPILVLTDRTEVADKPFSIRLGADDYVTRPFDTAELLRRMEVLLERVGVRAPELKVNVRRMRVLRDGRPVSMTSREFRLIKYLMERPGRCVSRGELLKAVWGYASNSTTRTIDVHIASLRKKLEVDPKLPELIRTIPKVGYMYVKATNIDLQSLRNHRRAPRYTTIAATVD